MGVYSERAAPTLPAPEGEAGACPRAPDDSPEAPPPLWEGRKPPQTKHQVHPETPPASPALLRGGKKKKKKSQDAKLPKKFPRVGKSAAQKKQSLKGEKTSYDLCKYSSTNCTHCVANQKAQMSQVMSLVQLTPTPSTSGVGVSIDR